MKEGSVVLAPIPQSDGSFKPRPAICLRTMLPYQDWLVCGVSTQLQHLVTGFDEILDSKDVDFTASGLKSTSLIRLGFLALLPKRSIIGSIGAIDPDRHQRLLKNLSDYLIDGIKLNEYISENLDKP